MTLQSDEEVGEGEIVRISATLVSVPVSVIDRQGKYVVDLQQRDFSIYEDGVEQSITHFSNIDQPFSVVLLMGFARNRAFARKVQSLPEKSKGRSFLETRIKPKIRSNLKSSGPKAMLKKYWTQD